MLFRAITQRRSLDPSFCSLEGLPGSVPGPPQSSSQEVSLLGLKKIETKGNPRGGGKFSDFQGWSQEPLIGSSLGRTYGREIWSTKIHKPRGIHGAKKSTLPSTCIPKNRSSKPQEHIISDPVH